VAIGAPTAEAPIAEAAQQPSSFWRFSLRLYPAVAETCLALQDRFGVDVNVLLFLLWAAEGGRKVDAEDARRVIAAVETWNRTVVVPLRTVRRALREPPDLVEPAAAERFRQRVKQIELEAERLQQEGLDRLVPRDDLGGPAASRDSAAGANVEVYAEVLGTTFAPPLVAALLAGFRRLKQDGQDE
jgi:uncharacterized protein (TIGR02444 family)